jgi:hypothetical protein
VRAVRGGVDSVSNFDRHMLSFTDPEGQVRTLSWDRLVLTPGSVELAHVDDHVMPEVRQKLGNAAIRVLRSRGIDMRSYCQPHIQRRLCLG